MNNAKISTIKIHMNNANNDSLVNFYYQYRIDHKIK